MSEEPAYKNLIYLTLLFTVLTVLVLLNLPMLRQYWGASIAVFFFGLTILYFSLDAMLKFKASIFNVFITSVEVLAALTMLLVLLFGVSPIQLFTSLLILFIASLIILALLFIAGVKRQYSEPMAIFFLNFLMIIIFLSVPYFLNVDVNWFLFNELLPLMALMVCIAATNRLKDAGEFISHLPNFLNKGKWEED